MRRSEQPPRSLGFNGGKLKIPESALSCLFARVPGSLWFESKLIDYPWDSRIVCKQLSEYTPYSASKRWELHEDTGFV